MTKIEKFYSKCLANVIGRNLEIKIDLWDIDRLLKIPRYQRGLRKNRVQSIAKSFNAIAATMFVVNIREDGKEILIDGNHRGTAAKEKGYCTWPCMIIMGLTEKEEASLWDHLNKDRSIPSASEVLNAQVIAANPRAVAIYNACKRYHYKLPFEAAKNGDVPINAISALYLSHELGFLDRILEITSTCWPGDPIGSSGAILRGLLQFMAVRQNKGKIDFDRLTRVLRDSRDAVPKKIIAVAEANGTGASVCRNVASIIQGLYNKGLRQKDSLTHVFTKFESLKR